MIFPLHKYSGSYTNAGFAKTSSNLSKHPYDQSSVNQELLQSRQKGAESWGKQRAALTPKEGSWIHWSHSHLALVQFSTSDLGRNSIYICQQRNWRLNIFLLACSTACWEVVQLNAAMTLLIINFSQQVSFLMENLTSPLFILLTHGICLKAVILAKTYSLVPWLTEKVVFCFTVLVPFPGTEKQPEFRCLSENMSITVLPALPAAVLLHARKQVGPWKCKLCYIFFPWSHPNLKSFWTPWEMVISSLGKHGAPHAHPCCCLVLRCSCSQPGQVWGLVHTPGRQQ